jgi:hypothetical protein
MIFEIKNRFSGDVQFAAELSAEYETQARSMQLGAAVRMAVQASAKLLGADLRDANLRGADLRGVDLWHANLRHANLRGADLRGVDLRHANLRDANLRVYCGIYTVIVTPSHVQIGCERRTPEQWLALTEEDADQIDGARAVEALRQDGPVIKAMVEQMRPDLADEPAPKQSSKPGPLRRALAFVWPLENA